MTPLTDFLLARIAEDEREAASYLTDLNENPPSVYDMVQVGWIEAGSPERVLAECEAKRRIVEHHGPMGEEFVLCLICTEVGPDAQMWPCLTLRLLALPYADHPDYREEWRP